MIDFWLQYKEILIPIIFGLVFCIAGFYVNYKIEYLKKNGIKTKGYIIDYVREYNYSSRNIFKYYYYPLVKFVDNNGNEGAAWFWQIFAIAENVGTITGSIVIFIVVPTPHWPAFGVNEYVIVPGELVLIAAFQVP